MKLHNGGRLPAALAATGALLFLGGATPALALAELEVDYSQNPDFGYTVNCDASASTDAAKGCYEENGDQIWVRDTASDGKRVAVHWRLGDDSRRGLCINTDGRYGGGWDVCDKNFIEGKKILIRVGTCDGDVSACNRVTHYGEWSAWDSTTT